MPGYEVFGPEERAALDRLFDLNGGVLFAHGFISQRNGIFRVREFEAACATKFGSKYAQAVSSGSAALLVGLKALGIGKGDEVILPAFTFIATAEAIVHAGAKPVFVSIDDTYNLCPKSLQEAISPRAKAVIPVHMLGNPAEMSSLTTLCRSEQLAILEDASQAVGAKYKGQYVGTIGKIGCYSFDAGKVIITGEGGLILTDDEDLYKRARAWHDHGHAYDESVDRGNDPAYSLGFNYRMTELQGAIGIEQLKKLNFILDCNRANKQLLKNQLIDQGFKGEFRRLTDPEEIADTLVFSLPTEALADKFATELRKQGIATKNIPDAMKWHYARHWSSILEHASQTSREKAAIDDTGRLLRRSIATPIFVKMTPESISGLADKLLTVSRKVL